MTSRIGRTAAYALASLLMLAACDAERATVACIPGDEDCDIIGPPSFDFAMGANGAVQLPAGTATRGASTVTLSLRNLKALTAGQYQFWLLGRDAQNLDVPTAAFGRVVEFFLRLDIDPVTGDTAKDPITGDPIFVTDSTIVSDVRTNAYTGSDDDAVTSVRVIIDSTGDGSTAAANHAVFVSLESSAAAAPGEARFLWRRIGVGASGAMSFGSFGGSDVINTVSPNDYVFRATGSGIGGVRGDEISVDLFEIARPPLGFFYRGHLVDPDGGELLVDTLHASWDADATLSRVSLYNADVSSLLPGVTGNEITTSTVRNCRSGSGVLNCANTLDLSAQDPFASFLTFALHLEPKGGSGLKSRTATHTGELPDEVRTQ